MQPFTREPGPHATGITVLLAMLAMLALTIGVECTLASLMVRRIRRLRMDAKDRRALAGLVFSCNLLTNPLMNLLLLFGVRTWGMAAYGPLLTALEIGVWVAEGWILHRVGHRAVGESLAMSAALNAASWLTGTLLQHALVG